jgi:hypothetical protein
MHVLVHGTVNPDGEPNSHTGVYLREQDLDSLVKTNALVGKPVKIEHRGDKVGEIVSAWKYGNRLDCVLRLEDTSIESMCAQGFVMSGRCPELSLGYSCVMQHSADGTLTGGGKEIHEVSIVRKGARHDCRIRGWNAVHGKKTN